MEHTDDSLTAGERGPTLIEDFQFREKLTRFDHERIPERVVHARGAGGAYGTFVKFHWRPVLGTHSLIWDEVQKIAGADPDFNRRDLWDAIEAGDGPEYDLAVQLVPEEREHDFDLLDATPTSTSPRPSRSHFTPSTSFPESISPTTRCCRRATSPTWTRS